MTISDTLTAREKRYGSFRTQACGTQYLKDFYRSLPGWEDLTPAMKEALDMNASKTIRILNGDPSYSDSWHDIAGYALLVENILSEDKDCAYLQDGINERA